MPKSNHNYYGDNYFYEEASRRGLNISRACDEAVKKLVNEGQLTTSELKIYREYFGKNGAGLALDHLLEFHETSFDNLDNKKIKVSEVCVMLDRYKLQFDRKIFQLFLDDINRVLPTFNKNKAVEIWDLAHG